MLVREKEEMALLEGEETNAVRNETGPPPFLVVCETSVSTLRLPLPEKTRFEEPESWGGIVEQYGGRRPSSNGAEASMGREHEDMPGERAASS